MIIIIGKQDTIRDVQGCEKSYATTISWMQPEGGTRHDLLGKCVLSFLLGIQF